MNRQMRQAWRSDIKRRKKRKKIMQMRSYNSIEEAQQAMQKAEDEANAQVLPQQRSIGYGDYWCRPIPEYGIFVFGRVWTMDELRESAKGEDIPVRAVMAQYEERFERGYRFGIAHSEIEPGGELGDTHIANMWPITEEEFEEAKEHNWKPTYEFVSKVFSEAQAAKRKARGASSLEDNAKFEVVEEEDNA